MIHEGKINSEKLFVLTPSGYEYRKIVEARQCDRCCKCRRCKK